MRKRGESEAWLDYYSKYQYIEYYRKRMEELEFVQKTLIKVLMEVKEKSDNHKDKSLVNQLSKTIGENSKVLAEFGLAPPILSRIKSLITIKYDVERNNNNNDNENLGRLKILHQNTKSGFYLQLDNEEISRKCNESQSILMHQKSF